METNTESNLSTDQIIEQNLALMLQQIKEHTQKAGKDIGTKSDFKQVTE